MNLQLKKTDGETGNVLFLILIAVALFAAISYVVTQSSRSGSGSISDEKQALSIAQILQNGVSASAAVQRMIINGVHPDQVTPFDDNSIYGIFAVKGGGAVRVTPPVIPDPTSNQYFYFAVADNRSVQGVGTTDPDIVMVLTMLYTEKARAFCALFNKKMGIPGVPGASSLWNDAAPGQPVACVSNYSDFYFIYYVLYTN